MLQRNWGLYRQFVIKGYSVNAPYFGLSLLSLIFYQSGWWVEFAIILRFAILTLLFRIRLHLCSYNSFSPDASTPFGVFLLSNFYKHTYIRCGCSEHLNHPPFWQPGDPFLTFSGKSRFCTRDKFVCAGFSRNFECKYNKMYAHTTACAVLRIHRDKLSSRDEHWWFLGLETLVWFCRRSYHVPRSLLVDNCL